MTSFFTKFQANVSSLTTLKKKELPQEEKCYWKEMYRLQGEAVDMGQSDSGLLKQDRFV